MEVDGISQEAEISDLHGGGWDITGGRDLRLAWRWVGHHRRHRSQTCMDVGGTSQEECPEISDTPATFQGYAM